MKFRGAAALGCRVTPEGPLSAGPTTLPRPSSAVAAAESAGGPHDGPVACARAAAALGARAPSRRRSLLSSSAQITRGKGGSAQQKDGVWNSARVCVCATEQPVDLAPSALVPRRLPPPQNCARPIQSFHGKWRLPAPSLTRLSKAGLVSPVAGAPLRHPSHPKHSKAGQWNPPPPAQPDQARQRPTNFVLQLMIVPPPPCLSCAKVRNSYGPYACSSDKAVACVRHIQLPALDKGGRGIVPPGVHRVYTKQVQGQPTRTAATTMAAGPFQLDAPPPPHINPSPSSF